MALAIRPQSATPLGLRTMTLLQKLNPHLAVASNAMVTFPRVPRW